VRHKANLGRQGYAVLTYCGDKDVARHGVVLHNFDWEFGDRRFCPKCGCELRLTILEQNNGKRHALVDSYLVLKEIQTFPE
jgi:hypothetical protein